MMWVRNAPCSYAQKQVLCLGTFVSYDPCYSPWPQFTSRLSFNKLNLTDPTMKSAHVTSDEIAKWLCLLAFQEIEDALLWVPLSFIAMPHTNPDRKPLNSDIDIRGGELSGLPLSVNRSKPYS